MTSISEKLSPIERAVLGKTLVDTLASAGIERALTHITNTEHRTQKIISMDAQTFPFPQLSLIRQTLSRNILEDLKPTERQ